MTRMNQHIQQLPQAFARVPKGRERKGQVVFMVPPHSLTQTMQASCCKSCDAGSIQIRRLKAVLLLLEK